MGQHHYGYQLCDNTVYTDGDLFDTTYHKETLFYLYQIAESFDKFQLNLTQTMPVKAIYLIQDSFVKPVPKHDHKK